MVVASLSEIGGEVFVSMAAVMACCAASSLSKSALKWSLLLLLGLAISFVLSIYGHYGLIWYVDLFMILCMLGMRQQINREWQTVVIVLQVVMLGVYGLVAALSGYAGWNPNKAVDFGNSLYMAQLGVMGFVGVNLSIRNYLYVRNQRSSGNKIPWRTMWQMT